MKLVCINTIHYIGLNTGREFHYSGITLGNIYECIASTSGEYIIMSDDNQAGFFIKENFITLDEHREKKLSEMGI